MTRQPPTIRRHGSTMIVVLVVVMMTTYACYQFVSLASVEHRTNATLAERAQLECCQDSAEELVKQVLVQPQRRLWHPLAMQNNPALFRDVGVSLDALSPSHGHFTVISAVLDEEGQLQFGYGISDEAARLSLDALARWELESPGTGREALAKLPGMTIDSAAAITDFLRARPGTPSPPTAQPDIGSGRRARPSPGAVGPQVVRRPSAAGLWRGISLEELLQVPEVSKADLYGLDQNRNHFVGQWEAAVAADVAIAEKNAVSLPLSYFLTPYSAERNVNCQGRPRVYLNQEDITQLSRQLAARLPREWADFMVAYRRYGPAGGEGRSPSSAASDTSTAEHPKVGEGLPIDSVYDLIGARVKIPTADGQGQMLDSPFSAEPTSMQAYLLRLADEVTVDQRTIIPGRVNINTAPPAVLSAIPGMDAELVERILAARSYAKETDLQSRCHAAWLLAEGWTTIPWMRQLEKYITAHGDVYRMQLISFFAGNGPPEAGQRDVSRRAEQGFVRWEVVVDASHDPPRVINRKNLTKLGRGFTLDVLRGEESGASAGRRRQETIQSLMETGGRIAAHRK